MKTRVFVVDDHPLLREGIAHLINNEVDMELCGEADNAMSATQLISLTKPDVAVVDISLNGDATGLEVLREITERHPDIKVLILSMHEETVYAERALEAGASGYIMKQEATEKLLSAIRLARSGETYLSAEIADRLTQRARTAGSMKLAVDPVSADVEHSFNSLTKTENVHSFFERLHPA